MKQVLIKGGKAVVEDVPAPGPMPKMVMVKTEQSCISVGTELSGLKASEAPMWKRALKNPDKVLKAFQMVVDQGVERTKRLIETHQNSGLAVGYSLAGKVVSVGEGIGDLAVGDRVGCAGANFAMHADFVNVPRNLVVPLPPNVTATAGATVTLGAIALQGVRRLAPTLGETVVVIGLGMLGQITVQLLKANGCKVIAIDLDQNRVDLAKTLGADAGLVSTEGVDAGAIARLTGGVGADGVVITAAAADPNLLNTAFALCRRKGRVVLVGDVPISIDRAAIYRNELEFLISTSYGPGRYDRSYEEDGLEYPIGYVRWTENRNMVAYLDMVAAGKISVETLIGATYPIEQADAAYQALSSGGQARPLAITLSYSSSADRSSRTLNLHVAGGGALPVRGRIRTALAGAGGFARTTHLPNIEKLAADFELRCVCSATGHLAKQVALEQRAAYATTDFEVVLKDNDIDLVLVAGRHDEHAGKTLKSIEAGKHVFVEKPLALTESELTSIETFYRAGTAGKPMLMTGFNRRFSPAIEVLKQRLDRRTGPMVATYRMNAGYVAEDHWTQGRQGGGRNIGEACHIYDLFTSLTSARATGVHAAGLAREDGRMRKNENFSAAITFDDGSLATLVYTSLGGSSWPKEQMEVFCDGQVFSLDDYKTLSLAGAAAPLWQGKQDKGHVSELKAFARALRNGDDWPIPFWQQVQATRISFDVERNLYGRSA